MVTFVTIIEIILFKKNEDIFSRYRVVGDIVKISIYSAGFASNRHSEFSIARGNIFEKNIFIYNHMEYIAVPKADFLKYFNVIDKINYGEFL